MKTTHQYHPPARLDSITNLDATSFHDGIKIECYDQTHNPYIDYNSTLLGMHKVEWLNYTTEYDRKYLNDYIVDAISSHKLRQLPYTVHYAIYHYFMSTHEDTYVGICSNIIAI